MKLQVIFVIVLVIFSVHALGNKTEGEVESVALGEETVQGLLEKYQETRLKQQSFISEGKSLIETNDTKYGTSFRYYDFEFGTDGDRVGSLIYKYKLESPGKPGSSDKYSMKTNYVWDGDRRYEYKRSPDIVGRVVIRDSEEYKQRHISIAYPGAPLMGIMYGDIIEIGKIIQNSNNVLVRDEQEKIGGSLCYVIDAATDHGQYTVWIDPKHGHNIAKAKIEKKEEDLAWGKALNEQKKKRFSATMKNVHFKKKNDVWVPMSFDYEYTKEYSDSSTEAAKSSVSLSKFEISPDFKALGTFKPKIDNGAAVFLNKTGIKYKWMDGEIIPNKSGEKTCPVLF